MDLDNLRAIRATLMWAMQDRFFAPNQFMYSDGIRAVRHAINELDAILPVITEAEAAAEFAANPERLAELKSKWQWETQ